MGNKENNICTREEFERFRSIYERFQMIVFETGGQKVA